MLDDFIDQYGRQLYSLCLKLYSGNQADAQDLYQESWLKAYKWFNRYDPSKNFLAWITKICVNTYRDTLRKQKLTQFITFSTNEEQDQLINSIPSPEENKEYEVIRQAIDTLPESLRLCILLYYFYGNNIEETAQALGIPSGTVKSRLSKARNVLKKELNYDDK